MGVDRLRIIDTGLDPVTAEREQWDDGNNTLALAPGAGRGLRAQHRDERPAGEGGHRGRAHRRLRARQRPRRAAVHVLPGAARPRLAWQHVVGPRAFVDEAEGGVAGRDAGVERGATTTSRTSSGVTPWRIVAWTCIGLLGAQRGQEREREAGAAAAARGRDDLAPRDAGQVRLERRGVLDVPPRVRSCARRPAPCADALAVVSDQLPGRGPSRRPGRRTRLLTDRAGSVSNSFRRRPRRRARRSWLGCRPPASPARRWSAELAATRSLISRPTGEDRGLGDPPWNGLEALERLAQRLRWPTPSSAAARPAAPPACHDPAAEVLRRAPSAPSRPASPGACWAQPSAQIAATGSCLCGILVEGAPRAPRATRRPRSWRAARCRARPSRPRPRSRRAPPRARRSARAACARARPAGPA